jgi:ribonuclease T2
MLTAVAFTAAVTLATIAQPVSAVDYLGGWIPTPPKQQCVDICVNSKATPTCLTNDPACLAKKQRPGDFDYMVLEQLFVPQFCRDLLKGVDSTISHQNVNPAPAGISCKPKVVKSELTIHGLWPNYNDGYAGCCNVTDTLANKPYNAAAFAKNQPALLREMKTKWVDPTQSNEYDTLCEIYNHEFQKHGICYNAFGDDWEKAAVNYFKASLTVAGKLDKGTMQINKWAASASKNTTVAAVKQLYTKKVQVFCSNVEGSNQFSAIRSCWAKPPVASATGPFTQIDCAEPSKSTAFIPCDATKPITLGAYVAPY